MGGGGGVGLRFVRDRPFKKKKKEKILSEEKNCMQHKCNRKLMGKKREKNILPTRLLETKFLMTRNHPSPPPPKELNGRPLR